MKRTLSTLMTATHFLGPLVLSSAAESAGSGSTKVKFKCTNGRPLAIVFKSTKAIVTPKGGQAVTLTQALAADGFRYTRGKYSLRGRGEWVSWATGHGRPLNCYARD
jgi:membrane-bound inhibitor of C-type lysozyme